MTSAYSLPHLAEHVAPLRCIIYTRISHDIAGLGLGVERQQDTCRAMATARGWKIVRVLDENDVSATKGRGDRKQYRELLDMLAHGEADVVLVWAQDRLLREPLEMEKLIELAERHPFTIAGVVDMGTDLATASGRHYARMSVANAKAEGDRKAERQRAASMQRAQSGKFPQIRAYGYEKDGSIREVEAVEVRNVFARFVAGAGLVTIARELNARGITNTKGGRWERSGIRYMLQNQTYISERFITRKVDGVMTPIYVGPGSWEPIVSREVFAAAGARLADPSRVLSPGSRRVHLGSGLYRCGECNDGTVSSSRQDEIGTSHQQSGHGPAAVRVVVYQCKKALRLLGAAAPIDAHVEAEVMRYLANNRISDLMADDRNVHAVKVARDAVSTLNARLKGLKGDVATGTISSAEYAEFRDMIQIELGQREAELAKLGERSALALLEGAADPGRAWKDLPVIEKARVTAALCTITVRKGAGGRLPFDPTSVTIDWTAR